MEAEWAKMFDPPTESPPTPDLVAATNPVPEVMKAAGYIPLITRPHTIQPELLHTMKMPTWDGAKVLEFYTFRDMDIPATANGPFPGMTIRVPRGAVVHAETSAKGPPPHTVHWHGIEPTPMNDGVGHCSMELGHYIYQFQPNFMGQYFYHCHRNTMQHFEFGLYGLLTVMAPDAYFASIASTNPDGTVVLNNIPIGACSDGKFRVAANLEQFSHFPGFIGGDPVLGVANGDPHAYTVPYDVEALWVLDDRDSVWSDLGADARATYPSYGSIPGVNDQFQRNPGINGFFAFNDFNPDYWFVTGVPVAAHRGGKAEIPPNIAIPPVLNSGVGNSQISINAQVGQTVLLRVLDAAYSCITVKFPVDIVIIAFDGRALGVPPFGRYSSPYILRAGIPYHLSTARRFDALIRATKPVNSFAEVEFWDTRGHGPGMDEDPLMTAEIPIVIS
jgi:hypothetical protein